MEHPSSGAGALSSASPSSQIQMGEVLRFARPKSVEPEWDGAHRNLFAATRLPGSDATIPFDSGINPMRAVPGTEDDPRTPAIIVTSSPHKVGSEETPWHDVF